MLLTIFLAVIACICLLILAINYGTQNLRELFIIDRPIFDLETDGSSCELTEDGRCRHGVPRGEHAVSLLSSSDEEEAENMQQDNLELVDENETLSSRCGEANPASSSSTFTGSANPMKPSPSAVVRSRRNTDHGSWAPFGDQTFDRVNLIGVFGAEEGLPSLANDVRSPPSNGERSPPSTSDEEEVEHMYHQIEEDDDIQITSTPGHPNSRSGETTAPVVVIVGTEDAIQDSETQSPLLRQLPRSRECNEPSSEGSPEDEAENGRYPNGVPREEEERRMNSENSPRSNLTPASYILNENQAQNTQLSWSHLQHDTVEIVQENAHRSYPTPASPGSRSGESTPPYINVLSSDNAIQVNRHQNTNHPRDSFQEQLNVAEMIMMAAELLQQHSEYEQENTFDVPRRRHLRDESTFLDDHAAEDGGTPSEYAQCVRSLKMVIKNLVSTNTGCGRSVREVCDELCTISKDLKGRIKDLSNFLLNDQDLSFEQYDDLLVYLEDISSRLGTAASKINTKNRQILNLKEEGDLKIVSVLSEIQGHIKFYESFMPILVDSLRYAFIYNNNGAFNNVSRSEVETLRQHALDTKSIIKAVSKSLVTTQKRIMWAYKLQKVNVNLTNNRNKTDRKCCICLEDNIVPGGDYAILNSCEHLFCVRCFERWCNGPSFRPECPLCKEAVAGWITMDACRKFALDDH